MAIYELDIVRTEDGILCAKEPWAVSERTAPAEDEGEWLANIINEKEIERKWRRIAQVYARKLAELKESRAQEQKKVKEIDPALEAEFRIYADKWLSETMYLSDPVKIFMHRSHIKIIGMGEKALPLILREVQKMSGDWSFALDAISPENPVKPEDRTDLERASYAWLEWGKERGLI